MKQQFYICTHCGKIIAIVKDSKVPVICCGEIMQAIIPGQTDASAEKHVPVIEVNGGKVRVFVGSVAHPMTEEHYIEWISLQTTKGNQRKLLKPGDKPEVSFAICEDEQVKAAFAFCNLHSLWQA